MKKLLFALVAMVGLLTVSCSKDEETTDSGSLQGRWEAPLFAEQPEDIAFVALFGEKNLDLYIIAWGQHLSGTYTYTDGTVNFDIANAYQAYTGVEYDNEGNMTSSSWEAGNLDATTLDLTSSYEWYEMNADNLQRSKEDFGQFEFKVNGNTATSTLVGIENITFNKVN